MSGLAKTVGNVAGKPMEWVNKAHAAPLKWMGVEDTKVGRFMQAAHDRPNQIMQDVANAPLKVLPKRKPTVQSTAAGAQTLGGAAGGSRDYS